MNTRFKATRAYARLMQLADCPIDLRSPGILSPARIGRMVCEAGPLRLLYATQRVDAAELEALEDLARETGAVEQFRAMVRGEVMNHVFPLGPEKQRVLHTASRNVFPDLPAQRGAVEHSEAAGLARQRLDELRAFLAEIGGQFDHLVQIGIGGSDLGPRALYLALRQCWQEGRSVHFLSNVDPDDAAQVLSGLNLERTLVAVISKSATTLETRTNEDIAASRFARALNLSEAEVTRRQFVFVTAHPERLKRPYRHVFGMDEYIGGRFSATSMVGGVPLGFGLGCENFEAILRGAREMDLNALNPNPCENLSLLAALLGIWNRNFLGYETLAILPYSQMLVRFVAHLQQLDMESNGKRVTRWGEAAGYPTGPIVWGEPGTNGQHAFYQLIHQSDTIVPCEFIGFRESQMGQDLDVEGTTSQQKLLANLLAQARALATGKSEDNPNRVFPGNRPSSLLIADRLDPRTLGALLAFYENKVAFQGFIWNINSFDQEGVQLGKVLADRFIAHLNARNEDPNYCGAEGDPVGWAMLRAAGIV